VTNNLMARLRHWQQYGPYRPSRYKEAADRIEKLEAALREIETLELDPRNSGQMWVETLRQIARNALGGKTDD